MQDQFVGITVMPEYYQHETIGGVLDKLGEAGATAVTTSPYVMEPVAEGRGQREPPIDAGAGKVRLLDRSLWGQHELWVRTAPSFTPDKSLYHGCIYQPPATDELTHTDGPLVGAFLDESRRRGLKTYLQVQAAIPPGYRVQFGGPREEDMPLLPDGSFPENRVAANASLAAPELLAYQEAMIHDLLKAYPQVDGFRFDWPEYPPYELDSIFTDFNPHVASVANQNGIDFKQLRDDAMRAYGKLHSNLSDASVRGLVAECETAISSGTMSAADILLDRFPFVHELTRLKRALTDGLLRTFRRTIDAAGRPDVGLVAHAFPPPWSTLSGIDFAASGDVVDHYCVKLYGMHWLMMLRSYAEQLLRNNAALGEGAILAALYYFFEISSDPPPASLEQVRYPGPGEAHPGDSTIRQVKVRAARKEAGNTPVIPLEHGYGPVDDFSERIAAAYGASGSRIWINRYCYLSDDKIKRIGELSRE